MITNFLALCLILCCYIYNGACVKNKYAEAFNEYRIVIKVDWLI